MGQAQLATDPGTLSLRIPRRNSRVLIENLHFSVYIKGIRTKNVLRPFQTEKGVPPFS